VLIPQEFGTTFAAATRRKVLSHKGLEQEGVFSFLRRAGGPSPNFAGGLNIVRTIQYNWPVFPIYFSFLNNH
jgi:hypothetical protein